MGRCIRTTVCILSGPDALQGLDFLMIEEMSRGELTKMGEVSGFGKSL